MKFKKFATLAGAALGAGALALAPTAANAAPISTLTVASTTASGSLIPNADVSLPVYGSSMALSCTSGSAAGTWNPSAPVTAPLAFSSLSLSGCGTFLPGSPVSLSLVGGLTFVADAGQNVDPGRTDVVTGNVVGPDNAVKVVAGTCTAYFGGTQKATYNEDTGVLSLVGKGLTVSGGTYRPTALCLGALSPTTQIDMGTTSDPNVGNVNFQFAVDADFS